MTISAEDSDFFTINSNTNSGNNFSYDVVDATAPVITLNGDASVTIEVGSPYNDPGATATDNYDGDLTAPIVVVSNVDTSTVGNYTVTYNVTDTSGNAATEVTRTIIVETLSVDGIDHLLSIYPNPATKYWNFEMHTVIRSLDIYDINGKQVISTKPKTNNVKIEIEQLERGVYLARLNSSISVKLIKQ